MISIGKIFLKLKPWFIYTILAGFCWAMWGTFSKYISGDVSPYNYHVLFTTGTVFHLPFLIKRCKRKDVNLKGILWGISASLLAVTGNIFVYQSFKVGGQASIVIPFTNLYPLITILIGLFLFKEKFNFFNLIGIIIVVPAIIILSGQTLLFESPELFFTKMQLERWTFFAFFSLLLFGLFNASQKITVGYISAPWSYVSFIISSVLISLVFITCHLVEFQFSKQTFLIGSMTGMFDGLGVWSIYMAYRAKGKASKVSPLVATIQQLITICIAIFFLGEKISTFEYMGIGLAVFGSWLLLFEKKEIILQKEKSS